MSDDEKMGALERMRRRAEKAKRRGVATRRDDELDLEESLNEEPSVSGDVPVAAADSLNELLRFVVKLGHACAGLES